MSYEVRRATDADRWVLQLPWMVYDTEAKKAVALSKSRKAAERACKWFTMLRQTPEILAAIVPVFE